jgi:hypothetical protein
MNRNIYLLSLLLLLPSSPVVHSQTPVIKKQKGFEFYLSEYLDTIGFAKADINKADIDFRVWHFNYLTGQNRLLLIVRHNDGKWTGKSLEYYFYNTESCDMGNYLVDTLNLANWSDTWKTIIDDRLLTAKDQKVVDDKLKPGTEAVQLVADGDGYRVEIATATAKRSFGYNNIFQCLDFYRESRIKSQDYDKMVELILLLNDEFGTDYKIKGVFDR